MDANQPNIKKLGWSVFFISASLLFFELSLVRMLSVVLYPSLAFFAITLVFFGLTISGLVVYFWSSLFNESRLYQKLSTLGCIFSASLLGFIFIFLGINPGSPGDETFKIIWSSSIPIILGNIYLIYVFKSRPSEMGKLYSFDLLGAGIGVIFCLILLSFYSPVGVIIIGSFLALIGSGLIAPGKKYLYVITFIFMFLAVFFAVKGEFPDIKYTKRGLERNIVFTKWNSFSRISLGDEDIGERFLYSLPSPDLQKVKQMGIEIDADAYTSILNFDGNFDRVNFLKRDLSSLAYHIVTPGNSLIIGPGGGRDVLMALLFKNKVTGADINPIIVNDLMKNRLKDFSGGLYLRPDVNIQVAEGRSFIKKDRNKYNSINLPLVDTWASTAAGNLAIVEGYLYTTEAVEDYMNHLTEDGILTISRWNIDGTKLITLFLAASEKLNIQDPAKHIAIVGRVDHGIGLFNYMFKKSLFTQRDLGIINEFTKNNGFTKIYIPGEIINSDVNSLILSNDWRSFAASYPTNILPSTDDKPFFFFTLPVSRLLKFEFINTYLPDGGLGVALKFAVLFTVICMALPFIFTFRKLRGFSVKTVWFLSYFGLLGLSFMLIEIALIQKFILYLEYPIYSYSVVIATILISAGLGSYKAEKMNPTHKSFLYLVAKMVGFLLIYLLFAGTIVNSTIGINIIYKVLITIALNGPPAFFMGMMMPLGIKRLTSMSMDSLVPWCWAINGSASILASVGAVFLALIYGFRAVIAFGTLGYIIALGCIYLTGKLDGSD